MRIAAILGLCPVLLSGCALFTEPANFGKLWNPEPLALPTSLTGRAARDIAGELIAASDIRCEDVLVGLVGQRNTVSSAFDVGGQALTGLASVLSPSSTANALSAGSGFLQSSRKTLDQTLFSGRDSYLIYEAVKRGRSAERAALFTEMQTEAFANLEPHEVLARVNAYDLNCGVTYGMSELGRAVSQSAPPLPPPDDR